MLDLIKKLKPSPRTGTILGAGFVFCLALSLPFIVGVERPFEQFSKLLRKEAIETVQVLDVNSNAVPPDFNPLNIQGAFKLSESDIERAAWSWNQAKRNSTEIWQRLSGRKTINSFYCGCSIEPTGTSGGRVDLASCGVQPRKSPSRASRLEWEHIMPASVIGQGRACWTHGAPKCMNSDGSSFKGRSCCEIADPVYNLAANDPVNLAPAIGEINGDRSNYAFREIFSEARQYGQCNIEIDFKAASVEPPDERKGDIARIYAYMSRAYGIPITPEQANTFREWMHEDPVSAEELRLNQIIKATGHRANPFVLQQ